VELLVERRARQEARPFPASGTGSSRSGLSAGAGSAAKVPASAADVVPPAADVVPPASLPGPLGRPAFVRSAPAILHPQMLRQGRSCVKRVNNK